MILAKQDMSPGEFLSTAMKLIREECIKLRPEKLSDKEALGNDDSQGNNESDKDGSSYQGNENQEELTIDKTSEAAGKILQSSVVLLESDP